MEVLLIRHGKTQGNLEKRYIGKNIDEPLLMEESQRIFQLKKELEGSLPENYILFSSPMTRCLETGQMLFEGKDIKGVNEFAEMDFGRFEGKNYKELLSNPDTATDYQKWLDANGLVAMPGGEDPEEFKERNRNAFYRLLNEIDQSCNTCMIIVCHGGTIMSILSDLTGKDYYDFMVDNLEGYRLKLEKKDGKWTALSYERLNDWLSA